MRLKYRCRVSSCRDAHKKIKPYSKWKSVQPLVLFLILKSDFIQFFHFVHDSCQSHNSLIKSRPSWRQWASFGLVQALWFGFRAMWTIESRKEPFILMCIPFICVTLASTICIFKERVSLQWSLLCLAFVAFICHQTTMKIKGQRVYSVLITCLIGSLLLSYFLPLCAEAFYWFIIKSYHSLALPCRIHLCLSFNHCHTAPLPCSVDLLCFTTNLTDQPHSLWLVSSSCDERCQTNCPEMRLKGVQEVEVVARVVLSTVSRGYGIV